MHNIQHFDGGDAKMKDSRVIAEKRTLPTPRIRDRFIEEGRQLERERVVKILKEDRKCQHGNDCLTRLNIADVIKSDYGIDIEKLINGE